MVLNDDGDSFSQKDESSIETARAIDIAVSVRTDIDDNLFAELQNVIQKAINDMGVSLKCGGIESAPPVKISSVNLSGG
jgi:hypothetical protein